MTSAVNFEISQMDTEKYFSQPEIHEYARLEEQRQQSAIMPNYYKQEQQQTTNWF